MDGGVREKRGDVRQQGCGGVRVVRQGGGGGGAGSGAALVWLGVSASGVGAAPGGGTGVATGFSGNRLVRSGRGCWLNSPGSCWTPAASRCATCPRSPPSSTPRCRPSTGTCSSSGGGASRPKPGDDGVAVDPRSPGIKSGGSIANAQVQAVICRGAAIGVCGGGSACGRSFQASDRARGDHHGAIDCVITARAGLGELLRGPFLPGSPTRMAACVTVLRAAGSHQETRVLR